MNRLAFGGLPEPSPPPTLRDRVELVQRLRASRKKRAEIFGDTIARDLPWDILLVLYASEGQYRATVTSLQADVGAPPTTVIRWIKALESKGYVVRVQHPKDRRIAYIALSIEGKIALDNYFEAMSGVSR